MSGGRPGLGKPLGRTPVATATAAGPSVSSQDPLHSGATRRGAWGPSAYLPVAGASYLSLKKLVPGAQEPGLGRASTSPQPGRTLGGRHWALSEHRELSRLEPSGEGGGVTAPTPGRRRRRINI